MTSGTSSFVTHRATITAEGAQRVLGAGVEKATGLDAPSVIAVVDASGTLLAMLRMDGSPVIGAHLAERKARTSILLGGADTGQVAQAVHQDAGRSAALSSVPDITILAGATPIRIDGVVVGAVGVSSPSHAVEAEIATAAAESVAG
ncbi:MAG: hypothetical protein AVDCRST_MAG52-2537 [uncultured Blastococcus sp.]|uniref:Heme-binding protein n=1 Tax=uncultured Blastococcus sp. TaxID=217144 RepID=A0A6J4IPY8_9ACTN|nr:MAG: hypothetical protein AVDCRST_MAG52-2537 [uncultured Blastococcus sp.]